MQEPNMRVIFPLRPQLMFPYAIITSYSTLDVVISIVVATFIAATVELTMELTLELTMVEVVAAELFNYTTLEFDYRHIFYTFLVTPTKVKKNSPCIYNI